MLCMVVLSTGAVRAETDNSGNLTSDGTTTYTYSAWGRLTKATVQKIATSYIINGLGQ